MGKFVEIFTDGACRGNPGPGGWGAILRFDGREKEILGATADSTNNRMELTAAIEALDSLTEGCEVRLTTDSKYVMNGITQWVHNWKKNNWLTASKKPVKNVDLWKQLDQLANKHKIEWCWVKGHSGMEENERVDALANRAIDEML